MSTTRRPADLELPPLEDVERALDLEVEDREQIPGLYNLNVERVPWHRLLGMQVLLAFAALHNVLIETRVGWTVLPWVALAGELYAVGAFVALRRLFTRFKSVHLGTVFLATDLGIFTLVVYATGGDESWLWPIYLIRVADQMWIGRRRAVSMGLLGMGLFLVLMLVMSYAGGRTPDWATILFKVSVLGALTGYLAAAAGLPWDLQTRTRQAKEMILRLEAQSLAIDQERARAEQASQAKSEFLARMSHELRTPLNSVVGFTNVLLRPREGSPSQKERDYLMRIRENGLHLLALINDVLDIARIDERQVDIHMTEVDLESLVRTTVEQLEGRAAHPAVRVSLSFPEKLAPARVDEVRLRQVLINLVGNALKFTPEGWVRVEVTADPETGRPRRLDVRDSGIGIVPERLDAIFDAFEQAEGGTSRKFEGTGLGLAISKALCALMGLDLTVVSQEGEGSTFSVHFPNPATETPPSEAPPG